MTAILLVFGLGLPLLALLVLFAFVRIMATSEVHDDIASNRDGARPQSLLGRFRAWLTSTPKKLDYRRDKRGRFRRVRRG